MTIRHALIGRLGLLVGLSVAVVIAGCAAAPGSSQQERWQEP